MKSCKTCVFALDYEFSPSCEKCFHHSNWLEKPKTVATQPMTNADHIRSMSDESLAKFIVIAQIKQIEHIREQLNLLGIALKANDFEGDLQRVIIWLKQPFKEKEE